jgi:phosphate-selective porin OprO/OprP
VSGQAERPATQPALATSPPVSPQVASASAAAPVTDLVSMGPKGLTVQSEDKRFAFNLRFPFMFDGKATLNNSQPLNGDAFYPRFFGPIFTVTLYKAVTGKLIVGFQDKSVTVVNAWLDVAAHPLLHLRLGKVLYPIALERQTLPLRIVLLEHGIASSLLPISEFGAQLWGATEDKLFEYQLTFGNGAPTNQHYEVDLDHGKDVIGRLFTRPFARTAIAGLAGFGLGFGANYGVHRGAPATPLTGVSRTLGGRAFFATLANAQDPAGTVVADGRVLRLVPQLSYVAGPLSLYGEYIRVSERLRKGAQRDTLTHQSYHAVAALVLTGEKAVLLDIVSPKRPFDLSAGGFGAFELVARFERLEFDEDAFPTYAAAARSAQAATAIGGGFNWIPTEIIRVMLNYEHTQFEAARGSKKLRSEELLGLRVQALF